MNLTAESQEALFDFLRARLEKDLTDWVDRWKSKNFWTAGNYVGDQKGMGAACLDEITNSFMRDSFGDSWETCEFACYFYEDVACEIRNCAQYEALELLNAHIEECNAT